MGFRVGDVMRSFEIRKLERGQRIEPLMLLGIGQLHGDTTQLTDNRESSLIGRYHQDNFSKAAVIASEEM
jgi:hypothetical protein